MSVTGFSVPNESDLIAAGVGVTQALAMSELDELDFRMMTEGWVDTGVIYGCAVSVSSAMTLAVAIGAVQSLTVPANVTAGNVTIGTAHATLPRFDLVVASAAGVKSVVAGVAAANPIFPSYAAGSIVLAAVYVRAATTSIVAADIKDKRAFVKPSLYLNVMTYGGAKGDDSTNDATAISNTYAACPSGGVVVFPKPPVRYRITSAITVGVAATTHGFGYPEIHQATTGTAGFIVSGGLTGVHFRGLKITGFSVSSYNDSGRAINFNGTNGSAITDVSVIDCVLDTWQGYGIRADFVTNFRFNHNTIRNIYYGGILTISAVSGTVNANLVTDVTGSVSANSYAIQFTRNSSSSLTTDPRSANIMCQGNLVKNVPTWDAFGTHAGMSITFSGNVAVDVKKGIDCVGGTSTGGTVSYLAPRNITITGNSLDGGIYGGLGSGIIMAGDDSATGVGLAREYATGTVSSNLIRRFGVDDSTGLNAALYCRDTYALMISGNVFELCVCGCIVAYHGNYGLNVTGNTFVDVYSSTVTIPYAIGIGTVDNVVMYSGNMELRVRPTTLAIAAVAGNNFVSMTSGLGWFLGDPIKVEAGGATPESGTVAAQGQDEVQQINFTATGGTLTVSYGGNTTIATAWNATAAVMQTNLEALASIGVGQVLVSKVGTAFQLHFRGTLAQQNLATVTLDTTALTGGSATVAVTQDGAPTTLSWTLASNHAAAVAVSPGTYCMVRGFTNATNDTSVSITYGINYSEALTPTTFASRARMDFRAGLGVTGGKALTFAGFNSGTWNPASVASGAISAAVTLTVTGAVVGDLVIASHAQNTTVGVTIPGIVTAADTVSVWVDNRSAGAVDIASGTVSVSVFHYT